MLTKDDLKSCGNSCILVFGVQAHSTNSAFTLSVTRGITMLRDFQTYSDSLGTNGNYKFYEYYRSCKNCTTIINVSTTEQKAFNVFVNFNSTDKIVSHQNETSADFELTARGEGILVITPTAITDKNHKDDIGYFFIEVHSHSDLNYTISVVTNQEKAHPLGKGMPTVYIMKKPTNHVYYAYRHDSSKGFFIHVQEELGFTETLVNAVPEGTSLTSALPKDQTHAQWSSYQNNDRNYIEISSKDANFCKKCTYVIKLESNSEARGTITIQESGKQTTVSKMTALRLGKC